MGMLFRCRTPTDWLCPCGRVARELNRHGVEYTEVRVGRGWQGRQEVLARSGQRHVPLLVLDGQAVCDSRRIVELLRSRRAAGASSAGGQQR